MCGCVGGREGESKGRKAKQRSSCFSANNLRSAYFIKKCQTSSFIKTNRCCRVHNVLSAVPSLEP